MHKIMDMTMLHQWGRHPQVTERISGDLARTSADAMFDAAEMDNVRSQKRFLSEVSPDSRSRCNS